MLLSKTVKTDPSALPEFLLEAVIERLGLAAKPEPTPAGLSGLYYSWCQRVPFDNILKLIHVRSGASAAFPGTTATDFFNSWLAHGAGGTCWAGANALHALLTTLGFQAERGISTMMVAPDIPPNHGTVRVRFGDRFVLVDSSMLHDVPLPMIDGSQSGPGFAANVSYRSCSDGDRIHWRPLHATDGFECRLENFGASQHDFASRYEATRGWSPFNHQLTARINRGDTVTGVTFGEAVTLAADGSCVKAPVDHIGRKRILIDIFGISEELADLLPEDQLTPPPPKASFNH